MDLNPGTLHEDRSLVDFEEWDSLTILSIISVVDEKFHQILSGDEMKKVRTVSDLLKLIDK